MRECAWSWISGKQLLTGLVFHKQVAQLEGVVWMLTEIPLGISRFDVAEILSLVLNVFTIKRYGEKLFEQCL